jgi:hypothetical protein
MLKKLLIFICLTMSLGASAAPITYTISYVSGYGLSANFTFDPTTNVYTNVSLDTSVSHRVGLGSYGTYGYSGAIDSLEAYGGYPATLSLTFESLLSQSEPSLVTWEESTLENFLYGWDSGVALATHSPVPLPAGAWLFLSAIAGLAGAKRLSQSKRTA